MLDIKMIVAERLKRCQDLFENSNYDTVTVQFLLTTRTRTQKTPDLTIITCAFNAASVEDEYVDEEDKDFACVESSIVAVDVDIDFFDEIFKFAENLYQENRVDFCIPEVLPYIYNCSYTTEGFWKLIKEAYEDNDWSIAGYGIGFKIILPLK